jgi:transposase
MGAKATTSTSCANRQRLQAQLDALAATVAQLQATITQLEGRLASARKDSSTSSKPPSSDLVKPPKPAAAPGEPARKIGGQPGHPKHERAAFPPEQVNGGCHDHYLELCPACGGGLEEAGVAPRVVQQVEILQVPLHIAEHRGQAAWCPHCQKLHYAALPAGAQRGGLAGPRLTTLIAYLKGFCHASFATVRKFLRDVVGLTLSRGQPAKILRKVSQALDGPYQELLDDLPGKARLNVDETGHKQNRERWWAWCFRPTCTPCSSSTPPAARTS